MAFMNDPEVLILDEPTSGLDPVMQDVFIQFVKEEKKRGKTILLSSHIFSEVEATCDRIAIIKDGRIMSEFVANDLKHSKTKIYEVEFEKKKDFQAFVESQKGKRKIKILNVDEENLQALISTNDKYINEVVDDLSGYKIKGFSGKNVTLEDYFMKFYKEEKDFGGAL